MSTYPSKAPTPYTPTRLGDTSASLPAPAEAIRCYSTEDLDCSVLGEGDCRLHLNFLTEPEQAAYFDQLLREEQFQFQQWYHMPNKRGELEPLRRIKAALANPTMDGLVPHYRFPVNNQEKHGVVCPMPPIVEAVRAKASKLLNCDFNHAVVLLYRNGADCIGYHKDKTLDIDEAAPIVSISLGHNRIYALRDNIKCPTAHQEFVFPSGSLFELGPSTNRSWFHSVRPDKLDHEDPLESCDPEASFKSSDAIRISITFRKVTTYRDPTSGALTGQGASHQSLNWPVEFNGEHRLDA